MGGAGHPCPPGVGLHQLPMRADQTGTTPGEGGLRAGALESSLIHSLAHQIATEVPPLIRHRGLPARGKNQRRNKTTAKVICATRKKQETYGRWIKSAVYARGRIVLGLEKGHLTHATTWMSLRDITPSDISWSQKDRYCTVPNSQRSLEESDS